jgi:hypothetical protein
MRVPFPLIFIVIVVLYLLSTIKILREYERGVIFRLGRLLERAKGPGIILVFAEGLCPESDRNVIEPPSPLTTHPSPRLRALGLPGPPVIHFRATAVQENEERTLLAVRVPKGHFALFRPQSVTVEPCPYCPLSCRGGASCASSTNSATACKRQGGVP